MKIFLLTLLAASTALAFENYDGPEYNPVDWSKVVPVHELPDLWKGTVYEKYTNKKFNPRPGRIIGGQEAVPHSHPYNVQLLVQLATTVSACGGTVVTTTAVLTAAHCITLNNVASVTIIAGAHNVQKIEPTQQRRSVQPTAFRIHPEWYLTYALNDIATIIVSTPFVVNNYVQLSRLAPTNSPSFEGFHSTTSGWGRTTNLGHLSPVLNYVNNTVLPNSYCDKIYGFIGPAINDDTICIDSTGGRGVCSGDSGGPLTVEYNGNRLQVGIASFVGWLGCDGGLPHVFERVSGHYTWIFTNVN